MPQVTFLPSGKTVDVPPGTLLPDAARAAGVSVELPCGGKGVCGRCLVRVESGAAVSEGPPAREGFALACRTRAGDGPLTVEMCAGHAGEIGQFSGFAEDMRAVEPELMPSGVPTPLTERVSLTVPEPKAGDGLSDLDRVSRALSAALGDTAEVPLEVLAELPEVLRQSGGETEISYWRDGARLRVAEISAERKKRWGLAADIGTTTVAAHLTDLDTGAAAASRAAYNAQIECGLDVISRIHYASTAARRRELRDRVLGTLSGLIGEMTAEAGISAGDIVSVSLAGNTTMIHLLLGIVPEYIRLEPYTPAVFEVPLYTAGELGLPVCPRAPVWTAPAVGSYVGGDVLSGLLCTRLESLGPGDGPMLLIDLGTNGELVLGGEDFLLACACSAGPAFEGGGIRHGCRASEGAIERVELDGQGNILALSVIGDAPVTGLCGSGAISLTAELFRNGLIDAAGHFTPEAGRVTEDGHKAFPVAVREDGTPITFSETDIGNLLRAKAAVFSACQTLLGMAGLEFGDLERVYVAGGFGRYLDLRDAAAIGLLPPVNDLRFLGNASLTGAYMTLVSRQARERAAALSGRITYIDLSAEPGYMDQYTAALFLPHTTLSFRD
ncbi:MAG: ASKHA domain-containing protein [Oscillospiraceae bacterium]|nr:ASKHA domain-containing protein [Oscillospiraceae bacterium]